jgi:hypothetical protein
MQKFEKVEYTKPFELLLLLISAVSVFFGMIFILNRVMDYGTVKGLLAFTITGVYFVIIKKKFIVKISDFQITSSKLEWNNRSIDFKNIEYYKIHWMKGAGIKFKLKNGKTLRLSSNDSFCNSEKFVRLCENLDSKLSNYNNNQIIRKYTFFESKQGYYFAVIITILIVIITIFKLFTKDDFNVGNIAVMLVSLGIIWSGVKWKRK